MTYLLLYTFCSLGIKDLLNTGTISLVVSVCESSNSPEAAHCGGFRKSNSVQAPCFYTSYSS